MMSTAVRNPSRRSSLPVVPIVVLLGAGALLLLLTRILVLRAIGIGLVVLAMELFFIHLYEMLLPRDSDVPGAAETRQSMGGGERLPAARQEQRPNQHQE